MIQFSLGMKDVYQPGPPIESAAYMAATSAYEAYIEYFLPKKIEGLAYLLQVRDHLDHGGSALAIFNHSSSLDAALVTVVVTNVLKGVAYTPYIFASSKFYPDLYEDIEKDPEYMMDPSYREGIGRHHEDALPGQAGMLHAMAKKHGIIMIPTVQGYRMEQDAGAFLRYNVELNLRGINMVTEGMAQGRVLVGISMEGTRTGGELIEANPGVKRPFRDPRVRKNTMILPIALQDVKRSKVNIFTPAHMEFGQPVFYDDVLRDIEESELTPGEVKIGAEHALMARIAAMLPIKDRGVYNDHRFRAIIKLAESRLEQRGSVELFRHA